MDTQKLQDDLFLLIAYLISSAHGLYDEPTEYGIYRLLDATGRLLDIMKSNNLLDDATLQELKNQISDEIADSMDSQRQRERLEGMLALISEEMSRRL